jgi:hypothetical protein
MATIQKERRPRKGVDMATMIAMLDRFGPDAKRRARMEEQDMLLKQQSFGLQEQGATRSNSYMDAQVAAMRANQERAAQEQAQGQEAWGLEKQLKESLMPIQIASASAGLGGALQQQGLAEQEMQRGVFGLEQQKATAPLMMSGLALDNVAKAQQPQMEQAKLDMLRKQVGMGMLGEQAAYAKQDPRVQISPTQLQKFGMEMAPTPQPADQYIMQLQQALKQNPQAALQLYQQASPQLQQMLPLSHEMMISLANGVIPPELARLFKAQNKPNYGAMSPDFPMTMY